MNTKIPLDKLLDRMHKSAALQFNIGPSDQLGWFRVVVFENQRSLQRARKRMASACGDRPYPKGGVYAFTWENNGPGTFMGSIYFALPYCGDAVVCHEMVHAAMWYLHRMRVRKAAIATWATPEHERLAEVVDGFVYDFWRAFTQAGFKRVMCQGFPEGEVNG